MELKITVDTDDLYGEDGIQLEDIFKDELRKAAMKNCNTKLASDKFKEFADLIGETIIAGVRLKMSNFLSEDIALTDKWGKAVFVGSIEDLIKLRFDNVILRPVDSSGKTIQGCTTEGQQTWVEWKIKDILHDGLARSIKNAKSNIERTLKEYIDDKLIEIKDSALKQQVDAAFVSILKQGE